MEKYNVKLMYRPQEKQHHIELIKDKFLAMTKATDILERIKSDMILFWKMGLTIYMNLFGTKL